MTQAELDAFIDATRKAFEGMLDIQITAEGVSQDTELARGFDVSAIIGLSRSDASIADDFWSVVLSLPEEVARSIVAKLLGCGDLPVLDENVADGIGELANVLVGAAKRGLKSVLADECVVSLPTVILGSKHRVFRLRDLECSSIKFTSDLGDFMLQVFSRAPALLSEELG